MAKPKRGRRNRNAGLQSRPPQPETKPTTTRPSGRLSISATKTEQFLYSAPIPPPQIVAGWEQVVPGSGDRILALTENQSSHRQGIENKVIDSNIKNEGRGQIFAFIFCMFVVLCGTFLILTEMVKKKWSENSLFFLHF